MRRALASILLLLSLATLPHAATAAPAPVVVASKMDTEGTLLGTMITLLLARHGIAVESKIALGPTQILRRAILAGQIDLYPEYTGNGAIFFHREGDPVWRDAAQGYAAVKALDWEKNRLVWLAAAPADNGWAIALRRDVAAAHKITTLTGFARYVNDGGRVRLAASAEFVENPGALPAFERVYGFTLRQSQLLILAGGDTAATIRAAAEGTSGVTAAMAYGTDGALAALGLVVLADDKHAEVIYRPAPVVRAAVLRQHPALPAILDPVFDALTEARLRTLNAKIAVDGDDAATVARAYLADHGFLK